MKSVILFLVLLLSGLLSPAQSVISYTYDKQGRLVAEHNESVYRIQLSYDPEGNFISKTVTNYTDISGVAERPVESACRVYPNPAVDLVTLESTDGSLIREICISDMQGRKLLLMECENAKVQLSINSLPDGVYCLLMETTTGTLNVLLLKQ
ncbi:MAG: T9SS type A sorting domain-containing protein [Bacteroidales bacterium]|nr:T9SS type A sorting domain-containing protein [Bacteroidales bacterium]